MKVATHVGAQLFHDLPKHIPAGTAKGAKRGFSQSLVASFSASRRDSHSDFPVDFLSFRSVRARDLEDLLHKVEQASVLRALVDGDDASRDESPEGSTGLGSGRSQKGQERGFERRLDWLEVVLTMVRVQLDVSQVNLRAKAQGRRTTGRTRATFSAWARY